MSSSITPPRAITWAHSSISRGSTTASTTCSSRTIKRFYRDFSGAATRSTATIRLVRQFIPKLPAVLGHADAGGWVPLRPGQRALAATARVTDRQPAGALESIAEDPMLRDTKIIAEAWDAAGAYQVGSFPGGRWAEWNGRFRDDIRQFWRGDHGKTGARGHPAHRSERPLSGVREEAYHSINFVTCHDGFTLNDLVTYNHKHNLSQRRGQSRRREQQRQPQSRGGRPHDEAAHRTAAGPPVSNMLATLLCCRRECR